MDASIEINTNCSLAAVRKIATLFAETLRRLVPEATVAAVELAVAEACTNLVLHGAKNDSSLPLDARLTLRGETLRVTLMDRGEAYDLRQRRSDASGAVANVEALGPSGRGIFLINDLMDRVDYEVRDGRNVMTLTKTVSRIALEDPLRPQARRERAT